MVESAREGPTTTTMLWEQVQSPTCQDVRGADWTHFSISDFWTVIYSRSLGDCWSFHLTSSNLVISASMAAVAQGSKGVGTVGWVEVRAGWYSILSGIRRSTVETIGHVENCCTYSHIIYVHAYEKAVSLGVVILLFGGGRRQSTTTHLS